MWQYGVKVAVTAVVVVGVAELAKRSSFWGAILASLPLTSILSFLWLYADTGSTQSVAALSRNIFWFVFPSLAFVAVLPLLLRSGMPFWSSLGLAAAVTVAAYFVMIWLLQRFQIHL
jgi:hypothetical protein